MANTRLTNNSGFLLTLPSAYSGAILGPGGSRIVGEETEVVISRLGGASVVTEAAIGIDEADDGDTVDFTVSGAVELPRSVLVYRPDDPLGNHENVYVDLPSLIAAKNAIEGCVRIEWDSTGLPGNQIDIPDSSAQPGGAWDFSNTIWDTFCIGNGTVVELMFQDSAKIDPFPLAVEGDINLRNESALTSPFTVPAGQFRIMFFGSEGRIVGIRAEAGALPVFDVFGTFAPPFGAPQTGWGNPQSPAPEAQPALRIRSTGFVFQRLTAGLIKAQSITGDLGGAYGLSQLSTPTYRRAVGFGPDNVILHRPDDQLGSFFMLATGRGNNSIELVTPQRINADSSGDYGDVYVVDATAADVTITLLPSSSHEGVKVRVKRGAGAFNALVTTSGSDTIDGAAPGPFNANVDTLFVSDGLGDWITYGIPAGPAYTPTNVTPDRAFNADGVAAYTNNITSGGTNDQADDWTDLTTYATDAAAIRNAAFQTARKTAELQALQAELADALGTLIADLQAVNILT
jgi:hypothetical protein